MPFIHTGLYAGIPAPPPSWLYSDNPFISFDSLEWTSTTGGKLNDGTSYKLTITAKDDGALYRMLSGYTISVSELAPVLSCPYPPTLSQ